MDWISLLVRSGCTTMTAANWAPVFAAHLGHDTLSQGWAELDDFLGQVLHESAMLTRVEEGLSYSSAERIAAVWPSRFKSPADAAPFVRNPQALANRVYGGRMGNREPDDGWTYRGRGLIQVTGRANYAAVGRALGLDLEAAPHLLATPAMALRSAIAWWERNVPDSAMGDIKRVTKAVNGGTIGLDHRQRVTTAVQQSLREQGLA